MPASLVFCVEALLPVSDASDTPGSAVLSDGFLDSSLAGGNVSLAFGAWLDSSAPVVFASSPAPIQAA